MSYYQPRLWTLEEISIIRSYYNHISNEEIQKKLHDIKSDYPRSLASIRTMAYKLGLSKKTNQAKWSILELEYIKSNYQDKSFLEIARDLNRTKSSTYKAFRRYYPDLKLNYISNSRGFSDFEINFLKENSSKSHVSLAKYLNRHRSTIQYKMKQLNIDSPRKYREFTKKEIEYLKENLHLSHGILAKHLKRDRKTITNKLVSMGLYKLRDRAKNSADWSELEIYKIKQLHSKHFTYKQIAKKLNRELHQVTNIIRKLGLKSTTTWTKEDDKVLLELSGKVSQKYISKIVNKSVSGISKRLKLLKGKENDTFT